MTDQENRPVCINALKSRFSSCTIDEYNSYPLIFITVTDECVEQTNLKLWGVYRTQINYGQWIDIWPQSLTGTLYVVETIPTHAIVIHKQEYPE